MKNTDGDSGIVLKSGFWYTVSNFLTRAMVFITTPIFSRLLTTEQFGNFHVFANWQSIFLIVCGIEIYATVNRARFDFTDEKALNGYSISCLFLSTLITGVVLLLYFMFPSFFEKVLRMDRKYILAMFAYLFTYPAFEMFQVRQRIRYNYKLSSTLSFGAVIVSSLLALFLAHVMENDRLFGRVLGQYMPIAILGFIFYILFLVKSRDIRVSYWKYAVKIAVSLVFSYLAGQILLSSDKIIVQHLSTAEAVAYLGISTSCAHIILIFVQCLNNAWSPWFYDKLNKKEYFQIRKTFKIYMWFIIFCTFGVIMIGPELVMVLGGKNYDSAVYLLPVNMLSGIFNLIVTQLGSLETFYKRAHYAAILTGITALINLTLDFIFVRIFGYLAASYVTALCYIILIVMHFCMTRAINRTDIFPTRDVIGVILSALFMIPLSLILYRNVYIRWGVVFLLAMLFLILIFLERKVILKFVKGQLSA